MATRDPRPEDTTNTWPVGHLQVVQPDGPVPAWAAQQMANSAAWAGRWAGCADVLALYLKRLEDDPDIAHALAEYRKLRGRWENPIVVAPAATRTQGDQNG